MCKKWVSDSVSYCHSCGAMIYNTQADIVDHNGNKYCCRQGCISYKNAIDKTNTKVPKFKTLKCSWCHKSIGVYTKSSIADADIFCSSECASSYYSNN